MSPEKTPLSPPTKEVVDFLQPYLPRSDATHKAPWVTLTYAASLDSMIAGAPGTQTILSGAESKSMTHYLRTQHDAILVGAGTAVTDDPGLNSRLEDVELESQPRPVIVDRHGWWKPKEELKVLQAAYNEDGKAPWIIRSRSSVKLLHWGVEQFVSRDGSTDWSTVLRMLARADIDSVIIEGGASVINTLLDDHLHLVDSIIVTVAPTYLGSEGVTVSPSLARRFVDVRWMPMGEDVVMCARRDRTGGISPGLRWGGKYNHRDTDT